MARSRPTTTARFAATRAIARLAQLWPDLKPVEIQTAGLDDRESRLAAAIYHTTVQRWITLAFLLNRHLRRRLDTATPMVRAVMLTGAAQLLFMEKLPAHAVVDEAVSMARGAGGGAGGLVNAVLRKIADITEARRTTGGFMPNPKWIPWHGGAIELREALLPPVKTLDRYLSVATSHRHELVTMWLDQFGRDDTVRMLLHSLKTPPTTVFVPEPGPAALQEEVALEPHKQANFHIWQGERGQLGTFLQQTGGWVQDPASHKPVAATADLRPGLVIDYCAGRGTKTRQLAFTHRSARIVASDPDPDRFAALSGAFEGSTQVQAAPSRALEDLRGQADLILLDVPCSNTGVLARRLEAKYRYSPAAIASVTELQRDIVRSAFPLLKTGGAILYSTCSLEAPENAGQARWIAQQTGLNIRREESSLPEGEGVSYHDGGYYALLQ
jgi:16S rRNA (cytosine967-C5)-methyltransferase